MPSLHAPPAMTTWPPGHVTRRCPYRRNTRGCHGKPRHRHGRTHCHPAPTAGVRQSRQQHTRLDVSLLRGEHGAAHVRPDAWFQRAHLGTVQPVQGEAERLLPGEGRAQRLVFLAPSAPVAASPAHECLTASSASSRNCATNEGQRRRLSRAICTNGPGFPDSASGASIPAAAADACPGSPASSTVTDAPCPRQGVGNGQADDAAADNDDIRRAHPVTLRPSSGRFPACLRRAGRVSAYWSRGTISLLCSTTTMRACKPRDSRNVRHGRRVRLALFAIDCQFIVLTPAPPELGAGGPRPMPPGTPAPPRAGRRPA